jgi:hypothetical protein
VSTFVQLTKEDCQYLLTLIAEMDSETTYTAKQRAYTIPKLQKIEKDPRAARLAYQDTEYLLDLIEDDDVEDAAIVQQRYMTQEKLINIQQLQEGRFNETRDIEKQREARRLRRSGLKASVQALQEKNPHVAPV